jgi:hypothetical protein
MSRILAAMVPAVLAAVFLLAGANAAAHRIDEYLQATIVSLEAGRVHGSMRLTPGESVAAAVISGIDSDGDGAFSQREQQAYAQRVLADQTVTVDAATARPRLLSSRFPSPQQMREGTGEVQIEYEVEAPPRLGQHSLVIVNGHMSAQSVYLMNVLAPTTQDIVVMAQHRDPPQTRYALDYRQGPPAAPASEPPPANPVSAWWHGQQPASLFRLGMRHIAQGTDHLLFLLVLLLPAPLMASGRRWASPVGARRGLWRVLGIATAFTVGHSVTLSLAAVGGLAVPGGPVEVLIAVSILVSAAHALRPIFPGREAVVATLFGLVHGMAFAATLDHLGIGGWDRVLGTLAFNLGIEAMQLVVIAAVLPSLMLASRSRGYRVLRTAGALFAGVASLAWISERLFGFDTGVDTAIDAAARHAPWLAAALLLASIWLWLKDRATAR